MLSFLTESELMNPLTLLGADQVTGHASLRGSEDFIGICSYFRGTNQWPHNLATKLI